MIDRFTYDVLRHASDKGRYLTGDQRVIALAEEGLLRDFGPQALAAGDHFLTVTLKGREALNEWQAAQPKPPRSKRRKSRQFACWETYREVYRRISFQEFLAEIWPYWKGAAS